MTDKKDMRERFIELLSPDSKNFLDTGLTMSEFMQLHRAEKLAASWFLQSKEEKRRRLSSVMQLSVELDRIRTETNFSTRLAEMAIEAVIEGDWKMVEEWAEHFAFDGEGEQRYIPIFATFHELLLQAVRAGKEMPA